MSSAATSGPLSKAYNGMESRNMLCCDSMATLRIGYNSQTLALTHASARARNIVHFSIFFLLEICDSLVEHLVYDGASSRFDDVSSPHLPLNKTDCMSCYPSDDE